MMTTDQVNEILLEMAKEIAVARFPYTGGAIRKLPDGSQVTREEYWTTRLTEEERYHRRQEAYAAWMAIGNTRIDAMMGAAAMEYFNEK
jgi:hypothetical protein